MLVEGSGDVIVGHGLPLVVNVKAEQHNDHDIISGYITAAKKRLAKRQELCYSSTKEHTFPCVYCSARVAHRKRITRQVLYPIPRSPERSLLSIVLCYILHHPRFWEDF